MRRLLSITIALLIPISLSLASCDGPVKEPSVAGTFYPSDPKELRSSVDEFLGEAEAFQKNGRLVALISPHAGYGYSGQVAAYGYRNLRDKKTIILIGPSHYAAFKGASVYTEGSFRTPLGAVKIDRKLAQSLINEKADVMFSPEAYEKEHSLEVQLPFLQSSLKNFRIVPILIGYATKESFDHLSTRLAEVLEKDESAVIIASTDLSHYHDFETAVDKDEMTIGALKRLSQAECQRLLMSGKGEMCGSIPVLLALDVARKVGANEGVLFNYANSGHVTGNLSNVVGYASVGIYRTPLAEEDRKELFNLARRIIWEKVETGNVSYKDSDNPRLQTDAAVFVTITHNGQLRGCIGQTSPIMPLYMAVQYSAVQACSLDPRFPPVSGPELDGLGIEISILSPFEPVENPWRDVVVGRDGLIIKKGMNAGLLLPQVPSQQGWDKQTYLAELCLKAGLPRDAWKEGATIYRFTADVFGEEH